MLHEEHHHHHHHQSKCKSSSSKKNKAKKVPQRGLGVAQLEKLRIEEQQKSSSAVAAASLSSSSNPSHSLVLPAVAASPQQQKQPCFPFLAARSATSPSSTAIDFFKADPIGFSAGNAEELKYLSSVWTEESGCFSNFDVPEGAMLENCGTSRSQHHHHHQYISPIRLVR